MILVHYHIAEVSLYEAGLCKSPLATDTFPNFQRLELLYTYLEASKSYFDIFFSVPVVNYIALSMPSWSHLKYSLANLHMLSSSDHPDWNLVYVRETIDFKTVLGRLIEQLESVNTLVGYEKFYMFSRTAKRMNRIKVYVEGKMAGPLQGAVGPEPDQMPDVEPVPETDDLSDFFQFQDDTWMRDIVEPPDYQFNAIVES
jgi:hypothetical protein